MSDHQERACPECGSFLHYSCKTEKTMSRDVEVLCRLERSFQLDAKATFSQAIHDLALTQANALSAAISALEELETAKKRIEELSHCAGCGVVMGSNYCEDCS